MLRLNSSGDSEVYLTPERCHNVTDKKRTKAQLINKSDESKRQRTGLKRLSWQAAEVLTESEDFKKMKRLELLLNNNPAVIYTCKYGGNWAATFISENVKRVFGFEVSEFAENPGMWVNGIHPDDKKSVIAGLDNLMKNDYHSHEYRFLHKDGVYRWVHDEIKVLRDKDGHPVECVGYWTDITERRKVEQKLQEREDIYRQLFANELDAIVIYNADTYQFMEANQTALNLYGYTREQFLNLKLTDISAEIEKTVESVAEICDGNIASIPLRWHRKKDGTKFPVEISPGLFISENHRLVCGIIRDITARKRAEEALIESERNLNIRARELEEINTALKVLLAQREKDKTEMEENILSNLKHLVLPYLAKLRKNNGRSEDLANLNILESNLEEIISPFAVKLSSKYLGLTPKEILVADLIKDGKQDKDIMEILNISPTTVKSHRQNIRKKLGIYSKKANLKTHLASMTK
ncbi:MAG: PAS domain S-box protein [Nitrospiraceae bacterium]|nr:MAG: PAS domain S-box protein [Nitrospiraceae bacterium]